MQCSLYHQLQRDKGFLCMVFHWIVEDAWIGNELKKGGLEWTHVSDLLFWDSGPAKDCMVSGAYLVICQQSFREDYCKETCVAALEKNWQSYCPNTTIQRKDIIPLPGNILFIIEPDALLMNLILYRGTRERIQKVVPAFFPAVEYIYTYLAVLQSAG